MILLKAKNISKFYNNNQILNKVSFDLYQNEVLSIFGPSGSGKTSLLNILGLLDDSYSGDLNISSENVLKIKSKYMIRRNDIGFIFQFHHLLPEFTIFENLLFPLYFTNFTKAEKKNLINDHLEFLNIKNINKMYPDQISGGERQRVSIIRSIINRPKIVLADEPTGNLDKKNSEIVLDLIHKLKLNYSISFIIATHDENVKNISDRVFLLENKELKLNR